MFDSEEDVENEETRLSKLGAWFKEVHPFWYIVLSLVFLCVWGIFSDTLVKDQTLDKTVVLVVNIIFAAIGSYGTYLQGSLSLQNSLRIQHEKFGLHAKSRYRQLADFLGETYRISRTVEEAQAGHLSETERLRIMSGVPDRMGALMRNIANSMRNWEEFAPNELESLREELLSLDEEVQS